MLNALAMYLADGVLGLVVWPIAAFHAPALIEPGGALFDTPVFLVFELTFLLGYSLWGASLIYARVCSRVALRLLMAGAVLFNFPVGMPFIVQALGGGIWGTAAGWLGVALFVQHRTTGLATFG